MSAVISLLPPRCTFSDQTPGLLCLSGHWNLTTHQQALQALERLSSTPQAVDAREVEQFDCAGVLLLLRFAQQHQLKLQTLHFKAEHQRLVALIDHADNPIQPHLRREYGVVAALERLGRAVHQIIRDLTMLLGFLGENLLKCAGLLRYPQRLRFTATVHHMEQVGLDAVPLVALLAYLVGVVIAWLGAAILRNFDAEIMVVELLNIAFLREFAVLLTAIVLAGRTASAFTAQIGAMKAREEIDAIHTLGLDPIELLVLPRIFALLCMLPLLTFIAMLAGLAGGVTVGAFDLDISPTMYLARMHETMQLRHVLVGLVKAPLFALVIALIGCLEGLKVEGTAQSVGERTTSSVVQTISLVIIIDAMAALWFTQLGW